MGITPKCLKLKSKSYLKIEVRKDYTIRKTATQLVDTTKCIYFWKKELKTSKK